MTYAWSGDKRSLFVFGYIGPDIHGADRFSGVWRIRWKALNP